MGFWFQKVKSPLGSMAGTTHSSSIWNNKLRAYILNHKQESEKEETRKTNTHPPTHILPPARLHLLNLP